MNTIHKKFSKLAFENNMRIVFSARKGIKPSIFYDFADFIKMPEKHLAGLLHIHPRTISNYKQQRKNLEPIESEHLLKLIALYSKGEDLFGTIDEFTKWLEKPIEGSKDNQITWLITPGGVDLVSSELDRIAYGYAI